MHDLEDTTAIIISDTDLQRLLPVLVDHDSDSLDHELHRATIVPHDAMPPDVVAMNREVDYEDCETRSRRTVRIVFPHDANPNEGKISVLAPIGSALLGLRVGQTIEWKVARNKKRFRVVEVRA
jgi:regulator of nucleoside diphosphate kinase